MKICKACGYLMIKHLRIDSMLILFFQMVANNVKVTFEKILSSFTMYTVPDRKKATSPNYVEKSVIDSNCVQWHCQV